MRAKAASFFQYPRWVAALVMAVAVWSIPPYSNPGQTGRPFPSFFCTPAILLHFITGYLCLILLCVALGIFVYLLATDKNQRRS